MDISTNLAQRFRARGARSAGTPRSGLRKLPKTAPAELADQADRAARQWPAQLAAPSQGGELAPAGPFIALVRYPIWAKNP